MEDADEDSDEDEEAEAMALDLDAPGFLGDKALSVVLDSVED